MLCRTCPTGFGLDVDRLLESTPSALFEEWRALYDLEPWDAERADYAADEIVAAIYTAHGVKPKDVGEYMRFLKKPKPEIQSEGEMKAAWEAICASRAEDEDK